MAVSSDREERRQGVPVDKTPLILFVDDYEDARVIYGEYLTFKGYRVVLASDGQEAIRQAQAHHPDLILLDERMPGMTGTQALLKLRSESAFSKIPIIAFTAHALDSERQAALEAGFDAVIPKPCLPEDLARIVEQTLQMGWR